MPKTDLAHQGKLHVPEEEASSSDEEFGQVQLHGRRKRKPQEGTAEWERVIDHLIILVLNYLI